MKNMKAFAGPAVAVGLWLLSSESGQCFYNSQGDANGQADAVINMMKGRTTAHYECGSPGELLGATGPMARANTFRSSTTYQIDETDVVYCGYRFYNAGTGRWLSRDPIDDKRCSNKYTFVRNSPMTTWDTLGLETYDYNDGTFTARVTITPTAETFAPCLGGPVVLNVKWETNEPDEGNNLLWQAGAQFFWQYGSPGPGVVVDSAPEIFNREPLEWNNSVAVPLPFCPRGKQSGSATLHASITKKPDLVTIAFEWAYSCKCDCSENAPFKFSYTINAQDPPMHRRGRK